MELRSLNTSLRAENARRPDAARRTAHDLRVLRNSHPRAESRSGLGIAPGKVGCRATFPKAMSEHPPCEETSDDAAQTTMTDRHRTGRRREAFHAFRRGARPMITTWPHHSPPPTACQVCLTYRSVRFLPVFNCAYISTRYTVPSHPGRKTPSRGYPSRFVVVGTEDNRAVLPIGSTATGHGATSSPSSSPLQKRATGSSPGESPAAAHGTSR